MTSISSILARRSDLSTFLVHLTRNGVRTAKENLLSIIESGNIEAKTVYGQASQALHANPQVPSDSQKVVCFTETPLEHINLLTHEIIGRNIRFAPYGIAVTKPIARRAGANPVWYIDMTPAPGGRQWLSHPLNRLIEEAMASNTFPESDIAKLSPFIEQMGTWPGGRKEFWWEREWRCIGNFPLGNKYIGIAPSDDFDELSGATQNAGAEVSWIDPNWGLEQIIGHLAGFEPAEIGIGN